MTKDGISLTSCLHSTATELVTLVLALLKTAINYRAYVCQVALSI